MHLRLSFESFVAFKSEHDNQTHNNKAMNPQTPEPTNKPLQAIVEGFSSQCVKRISWMSPFTVKRDGRNWNEQDEVESSLRT